MAPALVSLHAEASTRGGQLAIVYIAEAHASDEWPINSSRCNGPSNTVRRPRTLAERCAVVRRMRRSLSMHDQEGPMTFVDDVDDAFMHAYAAWPIRMYAIERDGSIAHVARPENARFSLAAMRDWLIQ